MVTNPQSCFIPSEIKISFLKAKHIYKVVLFPALKKKKYSECILLVEDCYLFSVFSCPVRDTSEKIDGINSFNTNDELCFSETVYDTLDPTVTNCQDSDKRLPFYECKNNCPGGEKLYTII